MLPDDVLLEIFDQCRQDPDFNWFFVWGPNGLVHVCQRWRRLVFGSPRRLDLQLPCTYGTPLRKNLSCWPPIPITIHFGDNKCLSLGDEDSLFAAFEHPGRIRQVHLRLMNPLLSQVFMAMRQQFPVLTHLTLEWLYYQRPPSLPSGFLGGSAPCLQYLHLEGTPLPELPTLLSSTSDIVHLYLNDILSISSELMVLYLAELPRLEFLHIQFKSGTSRPDRRLLPPITRNLLPALSSFEFWG
jgi:hypothetical protein